MASLPRRRASAGFTFAELLAAMIFMAVLLPVVIEGILLANRAAVVSEREALAARLGSNLLDELIVTGEWNIGRRSGTFAPDYPNFEWQLYTQDWAQDSVTELTLEVRFDVQGKPYSVRLSTLVNAETTTGTDSGTSVTTSGAAL